MGTWVDVELGDFTGILRVPDQKDTKLSFTWGFHQAHADYFNFPIPADAPPATPTESTTTKSRKRVADEDKPVSRSTGATTTRRKKSQRLSQDA